MKETQKNLPVIILNEGNLDFIFDMLDAEEYKVGLGVTPGRDNSEMREIQREDLKRWDKDVNPAISRIEIDPKRKRYIPLTSWHVNEMRNFIDENINHPYSEPIDYWGNKYEIDTGNRIL